MLLLIATLTSLTFAEDPLRSVLRSQDASRKLYSEFMEKNHLSFLAAESRLRYRIFLKSAGHVADYNEDEGDTGHYGVNKFSVMTAEEKKKYRGVNMTQSLKNADDIGLDDGDVRAAPSLALSSQGSLPSRKLWTDSGSVTKVKDQGSCGSCWAFAAVAAIETFYKEASGVLRDFSEQELLDCVYDDGCGGGTTAGAFRWSRLNGGRLAARKDRPFEGKSRDCRSSTTANAMVAAKISWQDQVGDTEEAHLEALQKGALAAGIEVSDKFYQYEGSIMRDTTCTDNYVNHIVTIVGYSTTYMLVKNSWGEDWGEDGFVRLARNHDNCMLYKGSRYPILISTGVSDSGPDPAADYSPPADVVPACSDVYPNCGPLVDAGCCEACDLFTTPYWENIRYEVATEKCAKTCGICGNAACPEGSVECIDGICSSDEHICT